MLEHILRILDLMVESLVHVWPYLLVTIPLAVGVRMSGASRYISRAFRARPVIAIFLATAVGAFSPFCSCGVVPVVAALLISGVPLAPVMSFWIASPSMDPEIFFLSVATLGWELAAWRLGATLVLSLGAGLLTRFLEQRGWLGQRILRSGGSAPTRAALSSMRAGWQRVKDRLGTLPAVILAPGGATATEAAACCASAVPGSMDGMQLAGGTGPGEALGPASLGSRVAVEADAVELEGCGSSCAGNCSVEPEPFWRRLLRETWDATWMVVKFMLLAFFLTALIKLYMPSDLVAGMLGRQNPWAVPAAALLGVPAYTSNLTALPMVGGLLSQGMSGSAALAFLIAGPTTTLPAMAAVYGLTSRRVFVLYVGFSLVGAVVFGYLYGLVLGLN